MKKIVFILTILALLLTGCKKKETPPVLTNENLQGMWVDNKLNHYELGGIEYNFEFYSNKFKMFVKEYSDQTIVNCDYINTWENYIKGTYTVHKNSMFLIGNYCDSLYQIKTQTNCPSVMPIGVYTDTLVLNFIDNETLLFKNKIGTETILLKK